VPQEFEEVKHIDAFYIVCATIAIIFQFLYWRFSMKIKSDTGDFQSFSVAKLRIIF